MNYVLIGKLVNTHGIKGEVRIISDFKYKSRLFVPGVKLYIGKNYEEVTIKSYRKHKNYDMCLFNEYDYINDVLEFKGSNVYANRNEVMNKDEYTDTDLIGMECIYNENIIGKVTDIVNNNNYKMIIINGKYVPMYDNFIKQVNLDKKIIILDNLEGII